MYKYNLCIATYAKEGNRRDDLASVSNTVALDTKWNLKELSNCGLFSTVHFRQNWVGQLHTRMEPKVHCMIGKYSTIKQHPEASFNFQLNWICYVLG